MIPFLADAITRLIKSFGFNEEETNALNLGIAGTVFGYGASLLKKQGVTLDRAIGILRDKWPGIKDHER